MAETGVRVCQNAFTCSTETAAGVAGELFTSFALLHVDDDFASSVFVRLCHVPVGGRGTKRSYKTVQVESCAQAR